MWTGLSGYAIGCWLARGNRVPTLSGTAYLSEDANATWVLYDKQGNLLPDSSRSTGPSPQMTRLLGRHRHHAWPMPITPAAGLFLAIAGHALWNGSSWGVSLLLSESDSIVALLLQLAWLMLMVLVLWLCILRWLPTIVLNPQD